MYQENPLVDTDNKLEMSSERALRKVKNEQEIEQKKANNEITYFRYLLSTPTQYFSYRVQIVSSQTGYSFCFYPFHLPFMYQDSFWHVSAADTWGMNYIFFDEGKFIFRYFILSA
jgi:hypothetical protein